MRSAFIESSQKKSMQGRNALDVIRGAQTIYGFRLVQWVVISSTTPRNHSNNLLHILLPFPHYLLGILTPKSTSKRCDCKSRPSPFIPWQLSTVNSTWASTAGAKSAKSASTTTTPCVKFMFSLSNLQHSNNTAKILLCTKSENIPAKASSSREKNTATSSSTKQSFRVRTYNHAKAFYFLYATHRTDADWR